MTILRWDKPRQVMTTEERQALTADGAPPGVYTPNMSRADRLTWKAKFIGGKNPRVEIRKTIEGIERPAPEKLYPNKVRQSYAQMLAVVDKYSVRLSFNGTADFDNASFDDLYKAVKEAREYLWARALSNYGVTR